MRFIFTCICLLIFCRATFSQIVVSGNVLDKSKLNFVEGVKVLSTMGKSTTTDSLGRYNLVVQKPDSIYFVYAGKPTQKFAVASIPNSNQFDISIHMNVKSKYSLLKEVVVHTKIYKQDSIENRETYKKVFKFHNPSLETSFSPGGTAGFDANELFNLFRPRYNKRMQKLQEMMIRNEEEQYVNYKFNKNFVRRITQINGPALDTFMVWYRPSYYFASTSSVVEFNQYILNASYQFKRLRGESAPPSFPQGGVVALPKMDGEK